MDKRSKYATFPYPPPLVPICIQINHTFHTHKSESKSTQKKPVISPELIREVETRMNRNYLPPALKMHNTNVGPHSPPTTVTSPSTSSAHSTARRIGVRTCKLPTVQEVGKFSSIFLHYFFLFLCHLFYTQRCR